MSYVMKKVGTIRLNNFFRFLSHILFPVNYIWKNMFFIAPFSVGTISSYFSINTINSLSAWLPIKSSQTVFSIAVSLLIGFLAALPTYKEKKNQDKVKEIIASKYVKYVVLEIQNKLDEEIIDLMNILKIKGNITMSLMLPFGTELFERAKRLKIMAASELLRPLPSMNLALDWGEGVAGQVWKDKLGAAAIVTDNSVIDFEAKGLTRISPTKRRSGNFGHKIGLCLFPLKGNWTNVGKY